MIRHSATVPWLHWLMMLSSFSAQGGETCDLSVHFREVFASYDINGFARASPLIGKAEQLADLPKGETEIARSANETQPA